MLFVLLIFLVIIYNVLLNSKVNFLLLIYLEKICLMCYYLSVNVRVIFCIVCYLLYSDNAMHLCN